ncbi:hypothetical protein [Maritalea myrionectae]
MAFAAQDWSAHEADFISEEFFGVNSGNSGNPDSWSAAFGELSAYAAEWVAFAQQTAETEYAEDPVQAHFRATTLRDIEINGSFAVAHKKFDGTIALADGGVEILNWQTIYFCKKRKGRWFISGFIGYLPNPMGSSPDGIDSFLRGQQTIASRRLTSRDTTSTRRSSTASQVRSIISNLAPTSTTDFKTMAAQALNDCELQLKEQKCELNDVFRITVIVSQIEDAIPFQTIFDEAWPTSQPTISISEARLPKDAKVQIEMWINSPRPDPVG